MLYNYHNPSRPRAWHVLVGLLIVAAALLGMSGHSLAADVITTQANFPGAMETITVGTSKPCDTDALQFFDLDAKYWNPNHVAYDQCTVATVGIGKGDAQTPTGQIHPTIDVKWVLPDTVPQKTVLFYNLIVERNTFVQAYKFNDDSFPKNIKGGASLQGSLPTEITVSGDSTAQLVFITTDGGQTWSVDYFPGHGSAD